MHESSLYEDNSFVTLTYSPEHLPKNGSLDVSHYQNFMKRLRKSLAPKQVRYYHCGEYGENLGRPHYHSILFNHAFPDKKYFSGQGSNKIYTSETLSQIWPFGFSVVGDVSFDSAAYVARYVTKKVTGENAHEFYGEKKPEYSTMSRRPGIGRGWYDKYKGDVYPKDRVIINGKPTRPPRFYDNQLASQDPAQLALLKIQRENNGKHFVDDILSDGRLVRVSDTSGPRLLVKEEVKKAQLSKLKRTLENTK